MNSGTPENGKHGNGGERIREAGKAGASAAKQEAKSRLDDGKAAASGATKSAARALDEVATSLSTQDQESLARVTSSLAEQLSRFATSLEQRSVDELTRDASRLAREHPGLFIAGGVAVGLALGRFFKASAERRQVPQSASGALHREADEPWMRGNANEQRGPRSANTRSGDGQRWLPNE